ncbi:MAG: hypothetical protein HYY06_10975 [Deltaproteobacteria bacterium]|nr:hypothetical protein [Deltaproteobacteria bacterium]
MAIPRVSLVLLLGLASCGARSMLHEPPPPLDAGVDAEVVGVDSGPPRVDAGLDAAPDAAPDSGPDAAPTCGDATCAPDQRCCAEERCVPDAACCVDEDCEEGLACLPCEACGAWGLCGVGDLGCGLETVAIDPVAPNLMLLVDRSNSMANFFPDGRRKWDVLNDGLEESLPELEAVVRLGLTMFPGPSGNCGGPDVDVAVGEGTAGAVLDALRSAEPLNATPLGDALGMLRRDEGLADPGRGNFILLVTDGGETCGREPVRQTELMYAGDPMVQVHVVGLGSDDIDEELLGEIAVAAHTDEEGGVPSAATSDELSSAIGRVVDLVAPCSFDLAAWPRDPELVFVFLGEAAVPRDDDGIEGFEYDAEANRLELHGSACRDVRAGVAAVQVVFGCPAE